MGIDTSTAKFLITVGRVVVMEKFGDLFRVLSIQDYMDSLHAYFDFAASVIPSFPRIRFGRTIVQNGADLLFCWLLWRVVSLLRR